MLRPILKNLINIIYWISIFTDKMMLSIIINLIALVALWVLNTLIVDLNDKWGIKQKVYAFITLTMGNVILTNLDEFPKIIDSTVVLSIIPVLVLINIVAMVCYTVIMIVYSITEVKELKLRPNL